MPILTTSASGRKLRVLLVLHELGPGAPSVPLVALSHLRREIRVHTVAPVAGRRSLEGQYRALGPLSLQPPWSTSLVHRAVRRVVLQKQRMEITRFDPDIIYVNSVQALEVARDANVPERPVVLHVHELGSYLEPLLSDQRVRLCEWPTKYVAVSEAVRRYLIDRGTISDDRVAMIHAFLADEFLSRAAGPAASATPSPRRLVVGGAGTPTWRKGIQLWLELAAALRELLPADWTVAFRWVGMATARKRRSPGSMPDASKWTTS